MAATQVDERLRAAAGGETQVGAPAEPEALLLKCGTCQRQTEAKDRVGPQSFECRACLSLKTLLSRRLGGNLTAEFTNEEKAEFFAKSHARAGPEGRYQWPVVKADLVHRSVKREIASSEDTTEMPSRPRSVWLQQGYSADTLDRCPSWTCPVLGELVKVPLRTESVKHIVQTVEERILAQEKALQEKKKNKSKKGDTEAPPDEGGVELEVPKPVTTTVVAKATTKAPAKAEGAPVGGARAKAKVAREAAKHNALQKSLAAKALASLTSAETTLGHLTTALGKFGSPASYLDDLQGAATQFQEWRKAAAAALPLLEAGVPEGVAVPTLPFTGKDLSDALCAFQGATKQAKGWLKEARANVANEKALKRAAEVQQAASATAEGGADASVPKRRRTKKASS